MTGLASKNRTSCRMKYWTWSVMAGWPCIYMLKLYLHGFVHLLSQKFPIAEATGQKAVLQGRCRMETETQNVFCCAKSFSSGILMCERGQLSSVVTCRTESLAWISKMVLFKSRRKGVFCAQKNAISLILSLSFQARKEAKRSRRWLRWCCLLTYPFCKQEELLHFITPGAKPNSMVQQFKYLNISLWLSKHANCISWVGRPLTCYYLCNCMHGGWWCFCSL